MPIALAEAATERHLAANPHRHGRRGPHMQPRAAGFDLAVRPIPGKHLIPPAEPVVRALQIAANHFTTVNVQPRESVNVARSVGAHVRLTLAI